MPEKTERIPCPDCGIPVELPETPNGQPAEICRCNRCEAIHELSEETGIHLSPEDLVEVENYLQKDLLISAIKYIREKKGCLLEPAMKYARGTQKRLGLAKEEPAKKSVNPEHWQRSAAYLAECHAATLEGLPKSSPKHTVERQISICKKALDILDGKFTAPSYDTTEAYTKLVRQRCQEAVENSTPKNA